MKWEYFTVRGSVHGTQTELEDAFNKWGERGWELVAVIAPTANGPLTAFFKRPKQ